MIALYKIFCFVSIFFFASCSLSSCITVNKEFYSENNVYDNGSDFVDTLRAYRSVAKLSVYKKGTNEISGSASGFAVSKKYIATAGHFCVTTYEGANKGNLEEKINVDFVSGNEVFRKEMVLSIVAMDEKLDLCILSGKHGLIPLKLERSYFANVHVGQKVYSVGSPAGIFPAKSVGYVVDRKSNENELLKDRLILSMPIYFGDSGSPILISNGHVVGMRLAGDIDANICVAQRSDVILKFIRENR